MCPLEHWRSSLTNTVAIERKIYCTYIYFLFKQEYLCKRWIALLADTVCQCSCVCVCMACKRRKRKNLLWKIRKLSLFIVNTMIYYSLIVLQYSVLALGTLYRKYIRPVCDSSYVLSCLYGAFEIAVHAQCLVPSLFSCGHT